jgi:hypothetical protein
MHQLLWQLGEDTADEISELQRSEEIDAWLDEQSELTVAYSNDLRTAVNIFEEELAARGFSVRAH